MGSLVAELAEKLSSATNNFDIDEGTIYVNTSADTVGIGTTTPGSKLDVQGTMQVGVNDTGHDVKFFGATAGAYLEWDESADELEIRGGAATPGKLLLSTAETTVVDGNKLGQIDFQAPLDSAGTDAILVGASIYAEADATFSSSVNATELVFATGASETATEKMRITSDGKVGIGTTVPGALLHVRGTSNPTITISESASITSNSRGDFLISNSDNSTVGLLRFGAETDNVGTHLAIFTRPASGSLAEVVRIDTTGKVGIGTTSPACSLSVVGSAIVGRNYDIGSYANDDFDLMVTNAGHDATALLLYNDAGNINSAILEYHNNVLNIGLNDSNSAPTVKTSSAISITASAVGIGTTAPDTYLLHLQKANTDTSITLGTEADNHLVIQNVDAASTNTGRFAGMQFTINASSGSAARSGIYSTYEGDGDSDLHFWTTEAGTHALAMTIDQAGKVGIGTTAPLGKIHAWTASGGGSVTYNAGVDELLLENSGDCGMTIMSGATNNGGIWFGKTGDTGVGRIDFDQNDGKMSLWTANTQRLSIDSTGNVGINTTSPLSQLDLQQASPSGTALIAASGTSNGVSMSGNLYKMFYTPTFAIARYAHNVNTSQAANLKFRFYVNNLYATTVQLLVTGWHYQNGAQTGANQKKLLVQLEGTTVRQQTDPFQYANIQSGTAGSNLSIGVQSPGNSSLYTDVTVTISVNWYCHVALTAESPVLHTSIFNNVSYV